MGEWDVQNRVRQLFGEECDASIVINEGWVWIVVWRMVGLEPPSLLGIGGGETVAEAWADVESMGE